MPPENPEAMEPQNTPPDPDGAPEIEDAYAPDESANREVTEDEPELLDPASRALEGETAEPEDADTEGTPAVNLVAADDATGKEDAGDTDLIPDESQAEADSATDRPVNFDTELSARRVGIELKRIETEVRELLENIDRKRKRKLTGSQRWAELEEDIISWRYTSRFNEETLAHLRRLITKRHHLFGRLCYLAGTRHTWNT